MELMDYIEMSPSPTMRQSSASGSATLVLFIFGITSAAFCVWLTVRIINRRERWAKWMLAAIVGMPVLYVASFGPAVWLVARTDWMPRGPTAVVFSPLPNEYWREIYDCGTLGNRQPLHWWSSVWDPPRSASLARRGVGSLLLEMDRQEMDF